MTQLALLPKALREEAERRLAHEANAIRLLAYLAAHPVGLANRDGRHGNRAWRKVVGRPLVRR